MIESFLKDKKTCYFISPHLDDAILSAGALISHLTDKMLIKVITVFSIPSSPPETMYAKRYTKACGFRNADALFKERKEEDRRAFSKLSIKPLYLNYVDACWRKKHKKPGFISTLLPEFNHIYPTRFHARTGKINPLDFPMMEALRNELKSIVSERKAAVFCPLGVGNHVDHIIVNAACSELFREVIYWSDYPYTRKSIKSPRDLVRFTWNKNTRMKKALISEYKTQIWPLFGKSGIHIEEEMYYQRKT